MKTEEQILELWKPCLREAVLEVFSMYKDDTKIILTESDLKCWLYSRLIGKNVTGEGDECKYSVHSEVTHYHPEKQDDSGNIEKDYHFRDMSLLQKANILDNEQILNNKTLLRKGFLHRGPALHIELKLARQGVNKARTTVVSTSDVINFADYRRGKAHEKKFVMVWGSRAAGYSAEEMIGAFKTSMAGIDPANCSLITPYIFDTKTLHTASWSEEGYKFQDITEDALQHCKEVFNSSKQ